MGNSQLYINGQWVDEEPLNDLVPDKVVIKQLEKKIADLRQECGQYKQKVDKLTTLVKLHEKTIKEFKKWRENFVSMTIERMFTEMLNIMANKEMEVRMIKQLQRFFKTNQKYQDLINRLKQVYGSMIQHEINLNDLKK